MHLLDVQVKNYKCILDSTCFNVDQLTCLVGKNESGKSAILQALYKINPVEVDAKYNALYEYPKIFLSDYEAGEREDGDNVIISHWRFTDDEILEIKKNFGENVISGEAIISIFAGYSNKRQWDIELNLNSLFLKKMEDFGFEASDKAQFPNTATIQDIRKQLKAISSLSAPEIEFSNWFNSNFPADTITTFAEKGLLKYLPKFTYFSEYQNYLVEYLSRISLIRVQPIL